MLNIKINNVIINQDSIDTKLHEYFKDEEKFDKMFQIYLKLHSSRTHKKSPNNGRLISKETFKKVFKDG